MLRPGKLHIDIRDPKHKLLLTVPTTTGTVVSVEVLARVGPFCITRSIYPQRRRRYQVTHQRTGLALRCFATIAQARKVAEALAPLGNWDRPASAFKRDKKLRDAASATMNKTAPLG